ncbi:MAG: polymer-forming cytoskeletal protein [Alphaproteobacteria bacterium]|nr:polymer-forming cytoskeletal protein [Alphaproteobacteria bacterium]
MKKLKRILYLKLARRLSRSSTGAPVPSIISENTKINGDIISEGIIHVDGQVEGDISCDELIIGVKGSVIGAVTVTKLQLYGVLNGRVSADNLFIAKSARLIGDATHNTIAIEPGAYVDGHCMRIGTPIPAEQGKPDLMLVDARKLKANA